MRTTHGNNYSWPESVCVRMTTTHKRSHWFKLPQAPPFLLYVKIGWLYENVLMRERELKKETLEEKPEDTLILQTSTNNQFLTKMTIWAENKVKKKKKSSFFTLFILHSILFIFLIASNHSGDIYWMQSAILSVSACILWSFNAYVSVQAVYIWWFSV